MLRPSHVSSDAEFAHVMSRKFAQGRFLIVGGDGHKIQSQFAEAKREAVACTTDELLSSPRQRTDTAHFETTVWFYPLDRSDDERVRSALLGFTDIIVLMPGPGVDPVKHRADLVQCFSGVEFLPDYGCDLAELNADAVCLRYFPGKPATELARAAEAAFARLSRQMAALRHSLELRGSELEDAQQHIASLEGKLLKLKEYQRGLKQLKEERRRLRKSAERRVGQVLLAPYQLPARLAKAIWKKSHRDRRKAATTEYQKWFEQHRANAHELEKMRTDARGFAPQPLISIVTPVFDTPVSRLEEAVQSVLAQAYENWELLLADDGSTDPDLLRALPQIAGRDRRVVLAKLDKHGGISAASNRGIELARGEWITFVDHDDVLEPDALFQIVNVLQKNPDADLIYSDEDKLGENGFEAPLFKPDWSPDFFLSYNYMGHLTAVRRDLLQKAGRFRSQFDSAQDYDLFFRVTELTSRIHHVPRVLYHWRRSENSSAISVRQKPEQLDASLRAIQDHLKRRNEAAHVAVDWRTHAFRVRRELMEPAKISILIANFHSDQALERCVESLTTKTDYPNYEILIVRNDNSSALPPSLSRFPHRLLRFSGPLNDSAAKNYAAEQSDGPWILFLDDTVETIDPEWLTIMAEHVQRPDVGAVGARLLNPTDTVEHAGIVVGVHGTAQAAFRGFPAEHPGTNRQLQITRNCSAVSSACMLTRREVFEQVGGFDETLSGALADVDCCLKIRRANYLIVYTPFAKLRSHATHDDKEDARADAILRQRWADALERDPFYNPNLSRERADFSLKTS